MLEKAWDDAASSKKLPKEVNFMVIVVEKCVMPQMAKTDGWRTANMES